jgi:hypothetical protein
MTGRFILHAKFCFEELAVHAVSLPLIPQSLEPPGGRARVARRVLDVLVPEIVRRGKTSARLGIANFRAHRPSGADEKNNRPFRSRGTDYDGSVMDPVIRHVVLDQAQIGHLAEVREVVAARVASLGPGMGRPRTAGAHKVLIRIIEIAGDDPRPETEAARRFDEEDREIPS